MNISNKLKIMACSAVVALIAAGGIGLSVATNLQEALQYTNTQTIPSIQILATIKSNMQAVSINLYRINLTDDAEQMAVLVKEVTKAQDGIRESLAKYDSQVLSDKGKELLATEKTMADDYFGKLKIVLERYRENDKAGAFKYSAEMGASRAKLSNVIEEHIVLSNTEALSHAEQANTTAKNGIVFTSSIILLASILIGVISFFVIRSINRSLAAMQFAISRIEGDLDFTVHAEIIGNDEISSVSTALNRLLDKLRNSLTTITASAYKVSAAAAQLALSSGQAATASAHQSDSASSMAASIEEMTVSINHVSDRSSEAHALSIESGKYAEEGESVIGQTVDDINQIASSVSQASVRIRELESNSSQISSIVSVIKEVAEQTNLLALNAAIEAARAGEQGRGFAVVADEVRKLAERTASSTKEIATMIDSIRSVSTEAVGSMAHAAALVDTGVKRAGNASEAIQKIGKGSRNAAAMVEEITSAIREQSQASTAIAGSVESIAQMAEESSAAAQNSSGVAHELDRLAQEMSQIVAVYRL